MKNTLWETDAGLLNNLSDGERALYSEVLQSIAEMRLLPGRKLTEEKLAEAFDVSRARVRQVLLLLESDGIVSRQRNKGAYIRHLTPTEAYEIFDARRLIELHLTDLAVEKASSADIAHLRALLREEKTALDTEDFAASTRLSGDFHLQLAMVSGHQALLGILQALISSSYLVVALYQKRALSACARHDHGEIVDQLEARDADALRATLTAHFDHVLEEMDFSTKKSTSRMDRLLSD